MQSLPPPFTPDSDFTTLDTPRGTMTNTTTPASPTTTTAKDSPLAITALARFEFEAGKANDGTKILMIEWHDDDLPRPSAAAPGGSWHVSWEGKQAVLPADERTTENTRRVYFLLPPQAAIPPVVTLSYSPPPTAEGEAQTQQTHTQRQPQTEAQTQGGSGGEGDAGEDQEARRNKEALHLNPLPAIFPPELGATGRAAGKKGVLHTIWAKKRLQVLEREIREECQANVEGIALHMALQEKEWIETNFGLGENAAIAAGPGSVQRHNSHDASYPMGPATPVSPSSGGKLGEKLKGLKLQTGERELSGLSDGSHFLSPQSPDMAVSSFNSFHNLTTTSTTNTTTTTSTSTNTTTPAQETPDEPRKTVAHYPPQSLQAAQQTATSGDSGFAAMNPLPIGRASSGDSGEELFAKALSPRTPDLPRSPFSFAPETIL